MVLFMAYDQVCRMLWVFEQVLVDNWEYFSSSVCQYFLKFSKSIILTLIVTFFLINLYQGIYE